MSCRDVILYVSIESTEIISKTIIVNGNWHVEMSEIRNS